MCSHHGQTWRSLDGHDPAQTAAEENTYNTVPIHRWVQHSLCTGECSTRFAQVSAALALHRWVQHSLCTGECSKYFAQVSAALALHRWVQQVLCTGECSTRFEQVSATLTLNRSVQQSFTELALKRSHSEISVGDQKRCLLNRHALIVIFVIVQLNLN